MVVNVVLIVLAVLVGLVLAIWAHLCFWTRRLALPMPYGSSEELTMPDGATIVLRRLARVLGSKRSVGPPVLLVHGLGANHRNNDLHPEFSLARYLESQGRDVWLVTLRSGRPTRGHQRRQVRFEAMALQDVPLAIAAVRERTGAPAIDYVGFSMGGMLLYAALGRSVPEVWLRSAVLCGSPGRVGAGRPGLKRTAALPRGLVPGLRLRFLSRLVAFASEWFPTRFHQVTVNFRNVPRGLIRAALVNLVEDIPASLNADFAAFSLLGEASVGGVPTLAGLATVSVPALFVAGSVDKLASVRSVERAFDAWAAERPETPKRLVPFGRPYGHLEDYGHGDLAFGKHVVRELFPIIETFFAEPTLVVPERPVSEA